MDRTILYCGRESTRKLQRVRFVTPTALPRASSSFYKIQVGVAVGSQVDYFGTFLGTQDKVDACVPFDLTGPDDLGFALEADAVVVADLTTFGSPPSLVGSGFHVEIGHGIDEPTRRDAERGNRDEIASVLDFLQASGAGDDRFFVPTSFTAVEEE